MAFTVASKWLSGRTINLADQLCIAVDAMSGDLGPAIAVKSSLSFLSKNPSVKIILVGDEAVLNALLTERASRNLVVQHAPDVVSMDDKPSYALRRKQQSSMAAALRLVKEGKANGCVSAGNTGALMILGRSILRMLPGIDRPAISKRIPSGRSSCLILDLGANVDSSAEHLFQFALLGSMLAQFELGIEQPRVALLNVGEEEVKGNEQVRLASHLLNESDDLNYTGFVEGGDIFTGAADVIVCDGFVGNVALKTSEGVVSLALSVAKSVFRSSWYGRLVGFFAQPVFNTIRKKLAPSYHNGAIFLGLQGVVIKSHGAADAFAFEKAIEQAIDAAEKEIPARINEKLDDWLV
ncbi:MAG: phosphate acyltransferase [Gammaproteobacteria bacterium]|nr:MAG: phosphate acyltransferase [Gammaproteobacteria bacterium]